MPEWNDSLQGAELCCFSRTGMGFYCAFGEKMIQIRGDFCEAKFLISLRIVIVSSFRAVAGNELLRKPGRMLVFTLYK